VKHSIGAGYLASFGFFSINTTLPQYRCAPLSPRAAPMRQNSYGVAEELSIGACYLASFGNFDLEICAIGGRRPTEGSLWRLAHAFGLASQTHFSFVVLLCRCFLGGITSQHFLVEFKREASTCGSEN
jgi:hypothetical protein